MQRDRKPAGWCAPAPRAAAVDPTPLPRRGAWFRGSKLLLAPRQRVPDALFLCGASGGGAVLARADSLRFRGVRAAAGIGHLAQASPPYSCFASAISRACAADGPFRPHGPRIGASSGQPGLPHAGGTCVQLASGFALPVASVGRRYGLCLALRRAALGSGRKEGASDKGRDWKAGGLPSARCFSRRLAIAMASLSCNATPPALLSPSQAVLLACVSGVQLASGRSTHPRPGVLPKNHLGKPHPLTPKALRASEDTLDRSAF